MSPRSSRASVSEIDSTTSVPATASSSADPMSSWPERCRPPASWAARSPRTARSRAPIRQRGPTASRTNAGLADGSWTSSSMLRRSMTAGWAMSAAAPTNCVGIPRRRSAESTATRSAPVAASTAMSLQDTARPAPRAEWVASISPTTHSISCAYVSKSAQDTAPWPLPFTPAVSGSTPACTERRCADVRLATSRMDTPERRFWDSVKRAAAASPPAGKCSGKSSMLSTLAPRQP